MAETKIRVFSNLKVIFNQYIPLCYYFLEQMIEFFQKIFYISRFNSVNYSDY